MELKQRIEAAIIHSGKKKVHIADEIDISPSAITQWITGQTSSIDGINLLKFARATGTRFEWLALEEGEMTAEKTIVVSDPMLVNAIHSLQKLPPEFRAEQVRGIYSLAEQLGKFKTKDNGTQ